MKRTIPIICCLLLLVLSLTACAQAGAAPTPAAEPTQPVSLANGGTILLSVNPEIAVDYDNDGFVTGITARNDDAFKVLSTYTGFSEKQARTVVSELVGLIGEAGYFAEDESGRKNQIILEIEAGSAMPTSRFVEDVVYDVQNVIDNNNWQAPLSVQVPDGETAGEQTGAAPAAGSGKSGAASYSIPAGSDYGTDYGTDYDTTDYGTDYDATDYDTTDYGTDYDTTDYGKSDYDNSDYGESDYDDSDYGTGGSSGSTGGSSGSTGGSGTKKPAATTKPAATKKPASYGGSDSGYSDYSDYSDYGES